jgi:signal transduction histidine kinase
VWFAGAGLLRRDMPTMRRDSPSYASGMSAGPDPATPLWRAAQAFRLLSCIYALGFQISVNADLARPALGWSLFAALIAWSAACAVAYLKGFGRRRSWVIAEVVVVFLLMLSTPLAASAEWMNTNQSLPTTLWATNATMSVAIMFGPIGGMTTGVAVMAMGATLKEHMTIDFLRSTNLIVEIAAGLAVGMAAQTARRAHTELDRAARLAAATEERERLSREVHDGAIQVLALVSRRGREIGGATADLAELAGQQERALRRLVSSGSAGLSAGEGTSTDLAALLRARESDDVSMSLPADPVLLDCVAASEVDAAVANALGNVAAHAGAGAKAFVLLEDMGDSVVVTVRDDGVGIAADRLAQAAGEGRMGVAKSIVGRMDWLGGSARLTTGPDAGTEWELTVSRNGRPR